MYIIVPVFPPLTIFHLSDFRYSISVFFFCCLMKKKKTIKQTKLMNNNKK